LRRENERLRRQVEQLRQQLSEQAEQLAKEKQRTAEAEKQISEAEKQISDLERQLALRLQNSTTSSKPPSSDGLAGEPRQRGRRKKSKRKAGGQPATAERIVRLRRPKESMRFVRCCHLNVCSAGRRCPNDWKRPKPTARSAVIR